MDVVAAVGEFVATIGDGESRQAAVWAIRSSCGRLVGVNRRWAIRPTSSWSELTAMRVPSRICTQGIGKVVHAVSRRSMGRLVLRPLCRNEVAILVCPPRRSTLIAVLRRVAMTCGPLPVRS